MKKKIEQCHMYDFCCLMLFTQFPVVRTRTHFIIGLFQPSQKNQCVLYVYNIVYPLELTVHVQLFGEVRTTDRLWFVVRTNRIVPMKTSDVRIID